jgi:DNA-binding XRE family transcriptional regulator
MQVYFREDGTMVRVRRRRKDDPPAPRAERAAPAARPAPKRARYETWDAQRVRALRRHMGFTQQQLSDELGTRQQTVSEWETGVYQPRGASARLLTLVAERAGFQYGASAVGEIGTDSDGQAGRPAGHKAG